MIDYINEGLFKKDSITKTWNILGDNINLSNADLYSESIELNETLSPEQNVFFGNCPASVFKFTTSAISTSFMGKEITVSIILNNDNENPFDLGTFIVSEETLSADKTKKDIVAHDFMYKIINSNVAEWYDSLTFPMTLASFRNSLFANMGVLHETKTLANDEMMVEKTIDADVISGAEVVKAICEINGVLGHVNRDGVFEYKSLSETVDYTINAHMYSSCEYADYEVEPITQLQIREESGDIGVVVGVEGNAYIVEDNFLVYGKTTQEMSIVATNLLNAIDNISFVPVRIQCIGNPCVEVGDRVEIVKSDHESIETIVLNRTMKGLQFLMDDIIAEGDEIYPENVNGINVDIKQLKGKSNVLERDIEQTRSTIRDVEAGLQTEIRQTAEGLEIEIQDLQSQIDGETAYYERVSGAPTLLNYPYWDFTTSIPCNNTIRTAPIYTPNMGEEGEEYPHFTYTETNRKMHRSDLCFVDDTNLAYRFVLENDVWYWKEIADTEYTQILSRLATLEATAEQLTIEYSELSVTLSDGYYTKVETDSKISQSAEQIQTTVSATYATKTTTNSLQSQITQQASQISAKVSQSGGSSASFAWELNTTNFKLTSNNNEVFKCTSSGVTVKGTITGSTITGGTISGATINGDCTMATNARFIRMNVGDLYIYGLSNKVSGVLPTSFYAFSSSPTMVYRSDLGGYVPVFSSGYQVGQYKGLSNILSANYILMS